MVELWASGTRGRDDLLASRPSSHPATVDGRHVLRSSFPLGVLALVALLTLVGCRSSEDSSPPGVLDREAFVEVYVALRKAALTSPDAELPEEERDRILEEFGVGADDLIAFAEAHGRDPDYMVEVWREIEERLNVPIDSTATDAN